MPSSSYKHINSLSLEAASILEFRSIAKDIKFFDSCVYLGLKTGKWQQDRIVPDILERPGYEKFKIIKYCIIWTHIYIKFKNPFLAKAAVSYFTNLDPNFTCEIASSLLAQWYYFERIGDEKFKQETYTVVDVQGNTPEFMNLLDAPIVENVLRRYGRPKISPFFGRYVTKVHAVFPTMAEALAASIALGSWHEQNKPVEFYYRVRIEAAAKEASLIKDCLKDYEDLVEAFKLDYFVIKDDSAWNRLKIICQELFFQTETAKFLCADGDSCASQSTDRFNGVTFTNSAMENETSEQPEFLPNVKVPVFGQVESRRYSRQFYKNSGQNSITQRSSGGERSPPYPILGSLRNYIPEGSGRQQTRNQTYVNKEYRKISGKKYPK